MTTTPPLTGVDIGVAAKAIRSLLDVLLDEKDVAFADWVALRALGTAPGTLSQPALRDGLVLALDVDAAAAASLLRSLQTRGLICYDAYEQAALTAAGRQLYGELCDGVAGITAQVYGGLDADELATTRRVLASVTARATQLRTQL